MTVRNFIAFLALAILTGCSSPPEIDPFISFNIVRSVDFPVSNVATSAIDTSITIHASLDTTEYNRDESSAYLLHTSRVARITLRSSDPGFTLDHLAYARVLIGGDTVGFGNIFVGTQDTLAVTQVDVTPLLRDTSYSATLQFKLNSTPQQPITLTAEMTIIHTAEHTTFAP